MPKRKTSDLFSTETITDTITKAVKDKIPFGYNECVEEMCIRDEASGYEHPYAIRYNELQCRYVLDNVVRDFFNLRNSDTEFDDFIVKFTYTKKMLPKYKGVTKEAVTDMITTFARTENRFNPVLDMLAEHDDYNPDSDTDHLQELYNLIGISEDDALSRTLIHKWMLQAIAIQKNGCYKYEFSNEKHSFGLDGILVLNGEQGYGKSQLASKFAVKEELFQADYLDTKDKDKKIKATRYFVYELEEIESTIKRCNIEEFKGFITRATDEERVPYAKDTAVKPRRTSYIGTCNTERFITDTTGSRRFWTIHIDNPIDIEALKKFDMLAVWKQVQYELEHANDLQCFRLTREEQQELAIRNGVYTDKIPAQSEIEDIIFTAEENPERYEFRITTVSEFKEQFPTLSRYDNRTVGRALKVVYKNIGREYDKKNRRIDGCKEPRITLSLPMLKSINVEYTIDRSNNDTKISVKKL